MATINYTYTDDNPNIVYTITCNCTRNSNTQITYSGTVTWNLRYSNSHIGTGYVLQCRATSYSGGDSGWISFTEYSGVYSGTTQRSFGYSFTASSNSANAWDRVTFSFRNNSSYDSGYNSCSTYTDFSTPALLWTNCTAPTSVSFSGNPEYLVPNSTNYIEVIWSGATAGTDNPISEYRVYYRYSSSGASPVIGSDSYKGVSNATSAKIPLSDTNRGQYLVVGVQSVGKYNSTSLKIAPAKKVNVRPNPPSISNSIVTIPSTEEQGSITGIAPGSLNFGSQSGSIYWASSSTGEREALSGNTLSNKAPGTYYFWTNDGLEDSLSYAEATIVKNVAPKVTMTTVDGYPTISTINLSPFNSISALDRKKAVETIKFKITSNKKCYYDLKIKYGENQFYYLYSKKETDSGDSETEIFNIRALGLPSGDITFQLNSYDDIEESKTTSDIFGSYAIPPLPVLQSTYNQFDDANITDTNNNDFDRKIRLKYSYDSYFYEKGGIIQFGLGGGEQLSTSISKGIDRNKKFIYYDVTINDGLTSGQYYDFISTLKLGVIASPETFSKRKTPKLDPTPALGSSIYIKPFTTGYNKDKKENESKTQKIIISKGQFSGTDLSKFYQEYNLDSSKNWWKSEIITPNGEVIDITELVSSGKLESDYFQRDFTITGPNFYNLVTKQKISKQGTLTCLLRNTITNLFGGSIFGQSSIVTLDFNEDPVLGELKGSPTTGDYLIEGGRMSFSIPVYTFSTNDLTISYLIDRQDGNGFVPYRDDDIFWYGGEGIPFGTGRYTDGGKSIPVKEITGSSNCYFALRLFDGEKEIDTKSWTVECKRIKMSSPTFSFNKADYKIEREKTENDDGECTIACNYTVNDFGYDPSQITPNDPNTDPKIKVSSEMILSLSEKGDYSSDIFLLETNGIKNYTVSSLIENFKNARLILKNTLTYTFSGTEITLTKTSTSNDLIIYGISPTVAYRQNYLGINTNSIKDKEILRIAPATGRNIITFLKADGSNNIMTLNLDTGALTGFNIDWNSLTDLPEAIDCGEIT